MSAYDAEHGSVVKKLKSYAARMIAVGAIGSPSEVKCANGRGQAVHRYRNSARTFVVLENLRNRY